MGCDSDTYNFKTMHGDMVLTKDFKINEATPLWELVFNIYNSSGVKIETWSTSNGRLERVDPYTWRIKSRKEDKTPGTYNYTLCYILNNEEKNLLKGKIIVKKHN